MSFKSKVKKIISTFDKFSPYPIFYPFVMSKDERVIFDDEIKESHYYLEFGLGGSSLRALQKSKAKIYTVESCPDWINHMRGYFFIKYFENKRIFIFPVDIGPAGKWGYPKLDEYQNQFEEYSSNIFELIDRSAIDLVLVDGRFRVACALKIILSCHENNNLRIMIHDFWNREEYHVLLKYFDTIKKADTIGVFSIKDSVDISSVENDYEAYKLNPQ